MRTVVRKLLGPSSIGRYGLIGITGVSLDLFVFLALLRMDTSPLVASGVGVTVGILNNYVLNSVLNFRKKISSVRAARFIWVGITGLTVSTILLHFLIEFEVDSTVAKVVTIPAIAVLQFLINKYWSFSGSQEIHSRLD